MSARSGPVSTERRQAPTKQLSLRIRRSVITSYSIHYTKLYERNEILERLRQLAAEPFDDRLAHADERSSLVAIEARRANLLLENRRVGLGVVSGAAVAVEERLGDLRITSYNVCYTKLLRNH